MTDQKQGQDLVVGVLALAFRMVAAITLVSGGTTLLHRHYEVIPAVGLSGAAAAVLVLIGLSFAFSAGSGK